VKLRLRLALTTLAVLVPIGAGLVWFNESLRDRAGEETLARGVESYMRAGGRAQCAASPLSWGGPTSQSAFDAPSQAPVQPGVRGRVAWQVPWGPPPTLFAYDGQLRPLGRSTPALPAELAEPVQEGREFAARRVRHDGRHVVEVLVPLDAGEGPCAFVLARGPAASPRKLRVGQVLTLVALPLALFFAALWLAIGPVLADNERRQAVLREFVANTTHDVMIPLTVLQGHLVELRRRLHAGEGLDEKLLGSSLDEAHYMGALMHNLGIVARLEAGEPALHRASVDLNALVARVMGRHGPIALQRQVGLESAVPEEPVVVHGDVTLLEQAVSNVVYNAIRHNRAGGHVAVLLERPAGTTFRLRVIDDGPGIAEAELSRLAERGFRGEEARTRHPEGQGIGLHITYQVAQLHGLSLTLGRSEYGGLEVELRPAAST
jgi:signal transduction histidine kinase